MTLSVSSCLLACLLAVQILCLFICSGEYLEILNTLSYLVSCSLLLRSMMAVSVSLLICFCFSYALK